MNDDVVNARPLASRYTRNGAKWLALPALLLIAGCSHRAAGPSAAVAPAAAPSVVSNAPAPPVAGGNTIASAPPPAQSYAIINQLPPPPKVKRYAHRRLRLHHGAGRAYLVDETGRHYDVARDAQGGLYPAHFDPDTHRPLPLYYDSARDDYYSVARGDDGGFYRHYEDDSGPSYYHVAENYDTYRPSNEDRPIIDEPDYVPPARLSVRNRHRDDWLWAIPVVLVAYELLKPHHHDNPPAPPQYRPSSTVARFAPGPIRPVVVNNRVTIINNNTNVTNRTAAFPPIPVHAIAPPRRAAPSPFRPVARPVAVNAPRVPVSMPVAHPVSARPAPPQSPITRPFRPQDRPVFARRPATFVPVQHNTPRPRPIVRIAPRQPIVRIAPPAPRPTIPSIHREELRRTAPPIVHIQPPVHREEPRRAAPPMARFTPPAPRPDTRVAPPIARRQERSAPPAIPPFTRPAVVPARREEPRRVIMPARAASAPVRPENTRAKSQDKKAGGTEKDKSKGKPDDKK